MIYNIVLFVASLFVSSPLGIPWDKEYLTKPEIQEYQYYYGSVSWGEVIYLGKEDILGMESEIQLFFDRGKIAKANLILGPAGINEYNCISKYKNVRNMLVHKYGKFNYIKEIKDPIIEDLLTAYTCYPILLGIHEIDTYWIKSEYQIELSLVGDGSAYYIEISYIHKSREKNRDKMKKIEIIRKF